MQIFSADGDEIFIINLEFEVKVKRINTIRRVLVSLCNENCVAMGAGVCLALHN